MADLHELQAAMGCRFRDEALLRLALTHPSVAHEAGAPTLHNQRLEFLGDSVLELALTSELYGRFPAHGEGPLTKARARLVNRRFLAERARNLGLGRHLVLSRGEDQHGGRDRQSALADAYEALVGAVFLDAGWEAARRFVLREFGQAMADEALLANVENPKGELQELLQAASTEPPQYRLEAASGPDHDRLFECAVFHEGAELGRGQGKSKKDAETQAAVDALRRRTATQSPGEPAVV